MTSDLFVRALKYSDFEVDLVMNLTDVGHLVSDADEGEDKLEKGARREGKTAFEIAEFYSRDFVGSFTELNMVAPRIFAKATEHVVEQIELIKKIEEKGFAYRINDGIYFDTKAYEKVGNKYGELSTLDQIREGARVEINKEKRDSRDFALWKFSYPQGRSFDSTQDDALNKRQMEWESPWGIGFPGWHIECSAMSMKYLGEQFDLHIGGEDLRSTHHPNEIAQSEAGTGKRPFVKYWVHGAFLLIDGGRMGKSLGNAYTLQDIRLKGFDPLDLRYFYLTGHYRKQLNFTWEALSAAKEARRKLIRMVGDWGKGEIGCAEFEGRFKEAISDDLNMPQALAVMWELIKSEYPESAKKASLLKFDEVLSLGLKDVVKKEIPKEIRELVGRREELRKEKKWQKADEVREEIEKRGYTVEDTEEGVKIRKRTA